MVTTAPTGIGDLTSNTIFVVLAVILLFIDVYIRVMTAVKTYRDEKRRKNQPVNTLETKIEDHEEKLRKDYARLNELEDGNRIMMRAMMALLSHEINGNSDEKLRSSYDEIQQYLIDR